MTREEAIANLKMIRVAFVEPITVEQVKLLDETFNMAIKALEQEPRWIPVSERLPEDGVPVLCSTKNGVIIHCYFFDDTDCRWYVHRNGSCVRDSDVKAWMPLPEPYKAESEGK